MADTKNTAATEAQTQASAPTTTPTPAPASAVVQETPAEEAPAASDLVLVLMKQGKFRMKVDGVWTVYKTGQQLSVPRSTYDRFRSQMELVR